MKKIVDGAGGKSKLSPFSKREGTPLDDPGRPQGDEKKSLTEGPGRNRIPEHTFRGPTAARRNRVRCSLKTKQIDNKH